MMGNTITQSMRVKIRLKITLKTTMCIFMEYWFSVNTIGFRNVNKAY